MNQKGEVNVGTIIWFLVFLLADAVYFGSNLYTATSDIIGPIQAQIIGTGILLGAIWMLIKPGPPTFNIQQVVR